MIKYSIIIPTYNREKELSSCLELLYPQFLDNEDVEVLVSSDSAISKDLIKKFDWVKFNYGPKKGPAANRNSAASLAEGKWLFFMDDDCLPQPKWLFEAIQAAKTKNGIYCIEGKTMAFGTKRRFDEYAPINENGGKLWSCNFGILKDTFIQLNGFDENFPIATMEDIDFKIRFEQLGQIVFVGEMLVLHPWRRKRAFSNFKNRLISQKRFITKHNNNSMLRFRLQRMGIFFSSIPIYITQLLKFRGRGFYFFLDKAIMNFCMIFI